MEILHTPADAGLPPLTSGMVGYLAYDVVRRLEVLPDQNPDDLNLPELVMMVVSDMAILTITPGRLLVANATTSTTPPSVPTWPGRTPGTGCWRWPPGWVNPSSR